MGVQYTLEDIVSSCDDVPQAVLDQAQCLSSAMIGPNPLEGQGCDLALSDAFSTATKLTGRIIALNQVPQDLGNILPSERFAFNFIHESGSLFPSYPGDASGVAHSECEMNIYDFLPYIGVGGDSLSNGNVGLSFWYGCKESENDSEYGSVQVGDINLSFLDCADVRTGYNQGFTCPP